MHPIITSQVQTISGGRRPPYQPTTTAPTIASNMNPILAMISFPIHQDSDSKAKVEISTPFKAKYKKKIGQEGTNENIRRG